MTLSIIIPWFKKLSLFKVAVRQNKLFLDKRVQVVIVMDEPSEEKEAVDFIASVHHVNWKVIVNDTPHEWRPPCKAINVGIRNSIGDYVAVMSPETMLSLPTNEYLFRVLGKLKTKRFYLTGQIHNIQFTQEEMESPCFADHLEYRRAVLIEKPKEGFGFILVPRETIEAINCYDEGRKRWGGDDDDIRIRLRKNKCKHICDPNIRLVHMWHNDTERGKWVAPAGKVVILTKQPNWGMDFSRVSYETRDETEKWEKLIAMETFPMSMGETIKGATNETTENNTNPHHPAGNDTATVAQDAGEGLGEDQKEREVKADPLFEVLQSIIDDSKKSMEAYVQSLTPEERQKMKESSQAQAQQGPVT